MKGDFTMKKMYVLPVMTIIRFEVNLVTDGCCDISY